MLMTVDEQNEMLKMIADAKDLNDRKNAAIDEIVALCNALIAENTLLKRQLEIAEWHIINGTEGTGKY